MATTTSAPSPLALVRRITTAALTAAVVGAGFVAVHLAGDRQAALATTPVTHQSPVAPERSQDPGTEEFAPVAPLGTGSGPQAATRGS